MCLGNQVGYELYDKEQSRRVPAVRAKPVSVNQLEVLCARCIECKLHIARINHRI